MAGSVIEAFPCRPIALANAKDRARRRRLWLLGVIFLVLVAGYFGYRDWQRASLRTDLRARGVAAEVTKAEGSCLSRRQVSGNQNLGCTYDIEYRLSPEHGGDLRTAQARLSERFLAFAPPILYDPENPDRAMFKPEVEREPDHVSGAITWAILILVPTGALLLWLAAGNKARAAAAADPKPAIVAIDRVEQFPNALGVWFERPGGGRPGFARFERGLRPLLVPSPPGAPPDRHHALALLASRGAPMLLDDRLSELELTEDERAAVLHAARG